MHKGAEFKKVRIPNIQHGISNDEVKIKILWELIPLDVGNSVLDIGCSS
jgi:hypothetical protein